MDNYQYKHEVEEDQVELSLEDSEIVETLALLAKDVQEEEEEEGDRTIFSLLKSRRNVEDRRSPSLLSSSIVKEEQDDDIEEVYSCIVPRKPEKQLRGKKRILEKGNYPMKKRLFYGKDSSVEVEENSSLISGGELPSVVRSGRVLLKAVRPSIKKVNTAAVVEASPGSLVKSERVLVKKVPSSSSSSTAAAGEGVSKRTLKSSKCKCKNKWVDEECIRGALIKWNPKSYLICEGCFNEENNQSSHACLGYIKPEELVNGEKLEEHFRKRVWYLLLKPSTMNELYEIYKDDHCEVINNVNDEVIMKNMKLGLWRIVKIHMSSVIDILHKKDKNGKKE